MAAINIFFVSTCSRVLIELKRLLTILEPANSIVTLTELRVARPLSKEAIRVTESMDVTGVTLGGGGGRVCGYLTFLHLPGLNTAGLFSIKDFRSSTCMVEAIGEKTLAPLMTASRSGGNQNMNLVSVLSSKAYLSHWYSLKDSSGGKNNPSPDSSHGLLKQHLSESVVQFISRDEFKTRLVRNNKPKTS